MSSIWLSPDEMQERIEILTAAVQVLFRTHPNPEVLRDFWDKHIVDAKAQADAIQPKADGSDDEKRRYETMSARYRGSVELTNWIRKSD